MDRPSKEQIEPVGDWLLVQPMAVENKTISGLLIPEASSQIDRYGTVVKAGQGQMVNGHRVVPCVKVGDVVMYREKRGISLRFGGEELLFMTERDFLAVISQ